jgi:hypothetical protein
MQKKNTMRFSNSGSHLAAKILKPVAKETTAIVIRVPCLRLIVSTVLNPENMMSETHHGTIVNSPLRDAKMRMSWPALNA